MGKIPMIVTKISEAVSAIQNACSGNRSVYLLNNRKLLDSRPRILRDDISARE